MRKRRGETRPIVFRSEAASVSTIGAKVAADSTIYADKAASWDRLLTERINHAEACTKGAESFSSRIRWAEIGTHHHSAGPYLQTYSKERAWREDHRRACNGEQYLLTKEGALLHPVSWV